MKNIQISQELFISMVRYFILEQPEFYNDIKNGLQNKLDAMAARELYSQYKTAASAEEREKARQSYLDSKGIPTSFRW